MLWVFRCPSFSNSWNSQGMPIDQKTYLLTRSELIARVSHIIQLEKHYMRVLTNATQSVASKIFSDVDKAFGLMPFWKNYPPVQRGRQPTGTSIPWSEIGENTLATHVSNEISKQLEVSYPGLPSGADMRFATENALIHFDVKLTGPNDNPDEVVASPNQISGDGED